MLKIIGTLLFISKHKRNIMHFYVNKIKPQIVFYFKTV